MMKWIKRLCSFILLCLLIAGGILLFQGYREYREALSGKSVEEMARQITMTKKIIQGNREGCDAQIAKIKSQIEEKESGIKSLVLSLSKAAGSNTEQYIIQQVDELHEEIEVLKKRLQELESITQKHQLSDIEFDIIRQLLSSFGENLLGYTLDFL